jgi:hypothetical protein
MINGLEKDAIELAKRVVDKHSSYRDEPDYPDLTGYECVFCENGYFDEQEQIKQDLDCPVLIGQDLITNK